MSGNFSLTLQAAQSLFANSTNFQTWTRTNNPTDAAARCYITAISTKDVAYERPYALIWFDDFDFNITTANFGSGTLGLILEANVSTANQSSHQAATYEFLDAVEPILSDVMTASYEAGNLLIRSIKPTGMPQRAAISENEDYFQWHLQIEYGATP